MLNPAFKRGFGNAHRASQATTTKHLMLLLLVQEAMSPAATQPTENETVLSVAEGTLRPSDESSCSTSVDCNVAQWTSSSSGSSRLSGGDSGCFSIEFVAEGTLRSSDES